MNYSAFTDDLLRHIHAKVTDYFPCLEGEDVTIKVIGEQQRPISALYRFEVASKRDHFHIFVKSIRLDSDAEQGRLAQESRARLAPPVTDGGRRTRFEYDALKRMSAYFEPLDDPRFGSIRVLDFIDTPPTIIMQENSDPTLRTLFAGATHLHSVFGRAPRLRRAFFNTGAWLRAFSNLPDPADANSRNTTRDDFVDSILSFADYLGIMTGDVPFFRRVEENTIAFAHEIMPAELPLGTGHGDFAMRNILVGTDHRISVFDTGARWQVPIYEDIAYFLVRLEVNGLQLLSQGLAVKPSALAACKSEFLAGYFGELPVPTQLIQLFQIQLLLDSWSARAKLYTYRPRGLKAAYHKLNLTLLDRRYKTVMKRLLNDITVHTA